MTIPSFTKGETLFASELNTALTDTAAQAVSGSVTAVQANPNTFTEPQTFAGAVNQNPGAGAGNQSPFAQYGDFLSDFIVDGLSIPVPSPASLTATLSTGTAVVLGQRTVVGSIPNATNNYAASSDTYVSLSQSGAVTYAAVANGGTAPAPASDAINILKVVTGPIQSPTPTLSAGTSGTLAAGTYEVALVAYDATGYGAVSASSSVTVAASGSIDISWANPLNETSMSIYATTEGGTTLGLVESGVTGTSYTYTGSMAPGAVAPSTATSNSVQGVFPLILLRQYTEVNVCSYGADPTGNTHSDAAFQAALAAALNLGGNGVLRIPAGNFTLSPEFTELTINQPISIIGEGFASGIVTNGAASDSLIHVTCGGAVVIKDLTLFGNNSLSRYGIISDTAGLNGFIIEGVRALGLNGLLKFDVAQYGGIISNCSSANGVNGFLIDAANCTLSKCSAVGNSGVGFQFTTITGFGGANLEGCTGYNNDLGNLILQGNLTYGVGDSVIVNFTSSLSSTYHGIYLDTYGNANTINDCYVEFAGGTTAGSSANYDGIHITSNNSSITINNTTSRFNGGSGISSDANETVLNGCRCEHNMFDPSTGGTGITINSNAYENWHIYNCSTIDQNVPGEAGIAIFASSLTNCSIIGGDSGTGVFFQNNVSEQIDIIGLKGYSVNNFTRPLTIPSGTLPNSAVIYSQIGNLSGAITSADTQTLPNTTYGQAVQASAGASLTLPTDNGISGQLIYFYIGYGSYSIVSNDNQFIYAPEIGLNGSSGPTTLNCSNGESVLLMSRGDGEFDVIGGEILISRAISFQFFNSLTVPSLKSTNSSTLTGTPSGTITSSMPGQGVMKKFGAYASGYENDTTTAQTITFPTAFNNTPVVTTNTSGLSLSVSTTELTVTAPDNTTTYSGLIIVEGF